MKKKPFTLLELTAAMGVFIIFMFFVLRFFNTSQDVMNRSSGKTDQYERARVVMDLLATDMQNIFYVEGADATVYYQSDTGTGDAKYTEDIALFVFRQHTSAPTETADESGKTGTESKTDLSMVQYKFDKTNHVMKLAVARDQDLKLGETRSDGGDPNYPVPGDVFSTGDFGVLAEGVFSFRVVPRDRNDDPITPSTLASSGSCRIPDSVLIELQLMDGETAAAIKAIEKVSGSSLPSTHPLSPENPNFKGLDKVRTFSRIVEIERGQN